MYVRKTVLFYACTYVGIFTVLSSSLWVAYDHPATSFTSTALNWYLALLTLAVAVLCGSLLIKNTSRQRLIPRVHLVSAFVAWLAVLVASTQTGDVAARYFLSLVEAASLFLVLLLVANRIRQTFAPQVSARYLITLSMLSGIIVVILSATSLNYQLSMMSGVAYVSAGLGHAIIVGLGFALVFVSLLYIPFGRPRLVTDQSYSVGPLVFSVPPTPADCNLIHLTEAHVTEQRRHLLKRGMWLHYHNHLVKGTGIVSTEQKSLESLITSLVEFAAYQNQARAISIRLYNDTRHQYIHLVIEYIVNTHKKGDFETYREQATTIGGALTVNRDDRTTELVLSFPLQW